MTERCKKTIAGILESDQNWTKEVSEHLTSCRDCRVLASEWQTLRTAATEINPPARLDLSIKAAARNNPLRFRLIRRKILKTVYFATAAACVILAAGVFFFNTYPRMTQRLPANSPLAAWHSGLDRHLFELDTELEINREMINLGPDKSRQEILDIMLPLPANAATAATDTMDSDGDNLI